MDCSDLIIMCLSEKSTRFQLSWLVFCQVDTSQNHFRRRNLSIENVSTRLDFGQAYGAFRD